MTACVALAAAYRGAAATLVKRVVMRINERRVPVWLSCKGDAPARNFARYRRLMMPFTFAT
jgi:hypothetical protein